MLISLGHGSGGRNELRDGGEGVEKVPLVVDVKFRSQSKCLRIFKFCNIGVRYVFCCMVVQKIIN